MAHAAKAFGGPSPEVKTQFQKPQNFFRKSDNAVSFRQSLQNASASATSQTQQVKKSEEASKADKTEDVKLKEKEIKDLYTQFFASQMIRLLPLRTPDHYQEESED